MDRSSDNVKFPALCLVFVEGSRLFFSQFSNILQKLSTKKKNRYDTFFHVGLCCVVEKHIITQHYFFFKPNKHLGFSSPLS